MNNKAFSLVREKAFFIFTDMQETTKAIVLKTIKYGDSSLIVKLYTASSGLKSYRKTFVDNTCDTKAVQNYYDWVKKMSSNDLTIVGFRPPSTLAMEHLEDSLSGFNYSSFIEGFENNGGVWLEFSRSDYVSYDGSHLHYESANKFSKNLGLKIEKYLK